MQDFILFTGIVNLNWFEVIFRRQITFYDCHQNTALQLSDIVVLCFLQRT